MIRTRYMTLISILTITLALIMIGIVSLLTLYATGIVNKIRGSEEVTVYLTDELSDGDMLALDETISSMSDVQSTRIVSKEDAAREFERMFGSDLLSSLETNPLPRSIIVTMAEKHRASEDMKRLADRLNGVSGIESVDYGSEWVSKLDIFILIFALVEAVLFTIIVTACILVISNTITLTVIARKEAIDIMKLVGATTGFIRRPFYYEGLIQGLISGFLSFALFYGLYLWVHYMFTDLDVYRFMLGFEYSGYISYSWIVDIMIPVGGVLGVLGSFIAVRRTI